MRSLLILLLGQGTSDAVCLKPLAICDVQFGDGEHADKVVCGKDVSAVITNSGTVIIRKTASTGI